MKKKVFHFLILTVLMRSFVSVVHGSCSIEVDKTTVVSWVIDGDTFDTTSGDRVRLADIDAPEKGESGYYDAKNFLIGLVYDKTVYLDIDDIYWKDKYGRLVSVVFVSYNSTHFKNVNKALLVKGNAVVKNYPNEFNPSSWSLYCPKEESPEPPPDNEPTPSDTPPSDTKPPIVSILSPENKTYTTSSVSLRFTIDEVTSWLGYSLDGEANKTIGGNKTISELSDGSHSLIVYGKDMAKNIGASKIIHFTIDTQPEPFPTSIIAVIVTIAVVGAIVFVYFMKFKK